jgi:hypothetical protein
MAFMMTKTMVAVLAVSLALALGALIGAPTAAARCTDQINYAGDPRPNVMINSTGEATGQCPVPIPQQNGLPGLVDGAVGGQACYNYPLFIFGQGAGGEQYACSDLGNNTTGLWVRSVPVIGVRQIGAQCASEQQYGAQSPDGRPLVCDVRSGWVPGP